MNHGQEATPATASNRPRNTPTDNAVPTASVFPRPARGHGLRVPRRMDRARVPDDAGDGRSRRASRSSRLSCVKVTGLQRIVQRLWRGGRAPIGAPCAS